jgi:hypothetical protein
MIFLVATCGVLFVLGMALVFGGTAALSFAAAPQVFRSLKPVDAGRAFGKVLGVFDRMTLWASGVAVVAAVGALLPEVTPPAVSRAVLAACVHLVVHVVRRGIAPRMAALKPPQTEDEERRWDPDARRQFDALHRRYVRLYAANLFLAAAALALAALGG